MAEISILPIIGDSDSGEWVFEVWLSLGDLLVNSVEVRGLNLSVDQGEILAVEVSGPDSSFSAFLSYFNEGLLILGEFDDDPLSGDVIFARVTVTVSEAFQVGAALTAAFDESDGFVQFGLSDLSTIEPSALPGPLDVAAQGNRPPTGVLEIDGNGLLGSNLIANYTLSDPDGIPATGFGAITYQWRRGADVNLNGVIDSDEWLDILGETQGTYQVVDADRNNYLSVVASYVDLSNHPESVASPSVQVWSLLDTNSSATDLPFKLNVQKLTEVYGNGVAVSVDFETGRVWLDDHPEIDEFFDASQLQDSNFSVRNFQGHQTTTSYLSETFYYGLNQKTLINWTPGDNVYQLPVARDHYFYLPNYELDATLVSVVEDGVLNVQTEHGLTTFYNIGTIIDSRGNDSMVGGDGDDILRASYSSSATVLGMDTYLGGAGDDTFRFEIWADSYNEAGTVHLADYEDGERIEVQTNGIDASNFKDVITLTYDLEADQTTASLLVNGYNIPALFIVDGTWEIIPASYRFDANTWFPETAFGLYDPNNLEEPTGEVVLAGFSQVGSSLSIQTNIRDVYGFGSYQYEWYADGVKLSEYTQAVLPIGETMLGKSVSARINYIDFLGQTRTFSSDPTLIKSTPTIDGVVVEASFDDQTARDISATVALLGDTVDLGTLTEAIVNKLLNVVDLPQIVDYEVGADSLVLSHTNGSVTYFEDVVFTPASPSAGSATAGRILHDDGDRLELGGRFSFSYDMAARTYELSSAVDVDYISRTGIGSTQNGSVTFVLSEFQFDESSVSGVVTEVASYDISDSPSRYAFSGPISFSTSISLADGEPAFSTLLDGTLEQYLFEDTTSKLHYQRSLTSSAPPVDIALSSLFSAYQFSEGGDLFHANQLPDTWDLDVMLEMGAGADSILIEDGGGAFLTIDTGAGNDRVILGGDGDISKIELGEGDDYFELKSLGQFGGGAVEGGNGADTLKLSFATENAFEIVTNDAESLIVKYLATEAQQTFIGFERIEFLDLTPPELIAFAVDFATGVNGQSATLTLKFSEDIQVGTGELLLKASSGNAFTQIQSIDINDSDVSISGNALTINTAEVFAEWGTYRFFLPTGVVKDLSGNGNASLESNSFFPDMPEGSGFAYGQKQLDMSDLFGFYDGNQTFTYTLLDDVNRLVDGFTISDVFSMQWTESDEQFRLSLGGEGFEVDATTGMLVAGLAFGMTLDSNKADNNGYTHYFSVGGSPFDVAVWSAALTSADAGSAANFLAQMLRAADQVTGSADDDTLLSFEGNDIIAGLGGDDFIDGGGGDDKAFFRGNFADYTVSFDSVEGVWVVTDSVSARDGEDRLIGVEQFVYIDSIYKVPNQGQSQ